MCIAGDLYDFEATRQEYCLPDYCDLPGYRVVRVFTSNVNDMYSH